MHIFIADVVYGLFGRGARFEKRLNMEGQINFFSTIFPPVYVSKIEGITSAATGKQTKGRFIACPVYAKTHAEVARTHCLS